MIPLRGQVERRLMILVARIFVGAILKQISDNLWMSFECHAARWRGVKSWSADFASTEAFLSIRILTTSKWPFKAARWRAVEPCSELTKASNFSSWSSCFTTSALPFKLQKCKKYLVFWNIFCTSVDAPFSWRYRAIAKWWFSIEILNNSSTFFCPCCNPLSRWKMIALLGTIPDGFCAWKL